MARRRDKEGGLTRRGRRRSGCRSRQALTQIEGAFYVQRRGNIPRLKQEVSEVQPIIITGSSMAAAALGTDQSGKALSQIQVHVMSSREGVVGERKGRPAATRVLGDGGKPSRVVAQRFNQCGVGGSAAVDERADSERRLQGCSEHCRDAQHYRVPSTTA